MVKYFSKGLLVLLAISITYSIIAFLMWDLDIAKWHWLGRGMFLLMSIGSFFSDDFTKKDNT